VVILLAVINGYSIDGYSIGGYFKLYYNIGVIIGYFMLY
jgi:hypothetical protein